VSTNQEAQGLEKVGFVSGHRLVSYQGIALVPYQGIALAMPEAA
jgi:hypothetical protein